jgi:hypothetical protein
MEAHGVAGGTASLILNFGARWKYGQFHAPTDLSPLFPVPCEEYAGCWPGPECTMEEERYFLPLPGSEPRSLGSLARSLATKAMYSILSSFYPVL